MKKSYLKWVGGKSRIMPHILDAIGEIEGTFFDVFGGSASVALNVKATKKVVNDLNRDLINCHKQVVADWKPLSFKLQSVSEEFLLITDENHSKQQKLRGEFYNRWVRDIYNNLQHYSAYKAALFLCINRLGFNGLWRVSKNGCNVSVGAYKTIYIPSSEMKQFADEMQDVKFMSTDFEEVISLAQRGDVVYLDPPYVKSNTSMTDFAYCEGGFTVEDHKRLAKCAKSAASRGVRVIISNHDTDLTRELYKTATKISCLQAGRSISCKGDVRGKANELIAVWFGS